MPQVLYAGDGPRNGPARYLLAVLHHLGISTIHVPPGIKIPRRVLNQKFDAIIFSDYSARDLSQKHSSLLLKMIQSGTGFLMIGGWGSFSGPFGGWKTSALHDFLPVHCQDRDDRNQQSGGFYPVPNKTNHPIISRLPWDHPPVFVGINQVTAKSDAKVLLWAHVLKLKGSTIQRSRERWPLLTIKESKGRRTAALTTDCAPHWAGGWVDWGRARTISVPSIGNVEIGDFYIKFYSQLVSWLIHG